MSDKDEEAPRDDEETEEAVPPKMEAGAAVTWENLRETIQQIVDDAIEEALELRGKGRAVKVAIAKDMSRIHKEIGRAVQSAMEGASAGLHAIDLAVLKKGLKGRPNTLMTRVRDEDLERMDLLVEAGLFESRSECAAFLIRAGLEARRDLVDKVQETAQRIGDLKDQLRRELSGKGEA